MTIQAIHRLYESRPFRPFVIHLADGRKIPVQLPEFMASAPSGRTIFVYGQDDSFHIIDLLLVTNLEIKPNGSLKKRKS